jgi:hypothetical protein
MNRSLQIRTFCVALLITWAVTAQAQDPVDPTAGNTAEPTVVDAAESLAIDAKIYAQSFGVPLDEALRRLRIMTGLDRDLATETGAEGADFAGAFFDNRAADFGLVIRTKRENVADKVVTLPARAGFRAEDRAARRSARADLRARFSITDQEVEQAEDVLGRDLPVKVKRRGGARHSLRELNAALTAAAQGVSAVPGIQTTYVDQMTGEIVLMVLAKDAEAARAASAKLFTVPFRIDAVPGPFVDVSVRGGQFTIEQSRQYCMTAFSARRNSDSKTGLITAAHCQSPNTISILDSNGTTYPLTQWNPINNTTSYDLMFLFGTPTAVAQFYYDNTGYTRTVTGTRSRASTTDGNGTFTTASTVPGSFVCHLGQKTKGSSIKAQSCGEVISVTGNKGTGSMTGGNYVILRNTQSGAGTIRTSGTGTLICFEGDSGGPVFAGTIAFGVASACLWWNNAQSSPPDGTALYLMYSSTDYFSSIGTTILVQ